MNKSRRKQRGFNLLELMIVMAIIGLLIGVSGYAWQVVVRRGNEAAAISFIKKINEAQAYYASKHQGKFANSFEKLVELNILDKRFADERPAIDGYTFELQAEEKPSKFYSVSAVPEVQDGFRSTGTSNFYLDSTQHTITFTDESRPANANDPSI